jgi:hypothetical protein
LVQDMTTDSLNALPGHVVETYMTANMLNNLGFSEQGLNLYHYRTPIDI